MCKKFSRSFVWQCIVLHIHVFTYNLGSKFSEPWIVLNLTLKTLPSGYCGNISCQCQLCSRIKLQEQACLQRTIKRPKRPLCKQVDNFSQNQRLKSDLAKMSIFLCIKRQNLLLLAPPSLPLLWNWISKNLVVLQKNLRLLHFLYFWGLQVENKTRAFLFEFRFAVSPHPQWPVSSVRVPIYFLRDR